ncbi:hypothetical protein NC652_016310 [Populus alba x Populus x berolinensis]|uniref:Uncharacterized protein n=1 Tax=Populus alba x Populus x berolinensis TaxID=444605 RepID=A0AAD6QMD5_9ROSI|nr:hypothetical protein NC652_016310 [Populus alba x Populus x berolinensis]KAJ6993101.1 hypothetical protein NC653_016283 [Populus alba x Populus x berolinensis]
MSALMGVTLRKSIRVFQKVSFFLMDVFSLWVSAFRYNSTLHSQHSTAAIFRRHSLLSSLAALHDR